MYNPSLCSINCWKKITAINNTCVINSCTFFPAVNGAQRWIVLGPLSFQPSELAKYVVVLFLAMSLELKGEGIKKFKKGYYLI